MVDRRLGDVGALYEAPFDKQFETDLSVSAFQTRLINPSLLFHCFNTNQQLQKASKRHQQSENGKDFEAVPPFRSTNTTQSSIHYRVE